MAFLAPLLPAIASSLISTLTGTALRKIIGDAPSEDIVALVEHGLESNLGKIITQNPEAAEEMQVKLPQWQRDIGDMMVSPMTQLQSNTQQLVAGQVGRDTSANLPTSEASGSRELSTANPNLQQSSFHTAMNPQVLQPQRQALTAHKFSEMPSGQILTLEGQSLAPLRSAQPSASPEASMVTRPTNQITDSLTLTPTLSENTVRYAANHRAIDAIKEKWRKEAMPGIELTLDQPQQQPTTAGLVKENLKELGRNMLNGAERGLVYSITGRSRADRIRSSMPYTLRTPGRVEITEVRDDEIQKPAITQRIVPAILPAGYIERGPQTMTNQGSQVVFPKPYSFQRNMNASRLYDFNIGTNAESKRRDSVAHSLSDVLKHGAKSAAAGALGAAAQFALRKIVGDSPTGMVKIVGDAPVPTGMVELSKDNNKEKIVGDAPSDGKATLGDAQAKNMDMTTAGGADHSTLMRYISMVQLLEQTLAVDSSSDWSSYSAFVSGVANNFKHILAEYDTTSISIMTQYWGSAFLPTIFSSGELGDNGMQAMLFYLGWQWRIEAIEAVASPPLLATNDFSSLLTATRGGVITEFSSAMRLNISAFSSESMAYLIHLIGDMVQGSRGYSFCDHLLRILLSIQCLYPIPGTEASEWWWGIHWLERRNHEFQDFWARDEIFPVHHVNREPGISIAIITYEQFILHAAGKSTRPWLLAWDKSTWGDSTAVLFLKNEDRSDPLRWVAKLRGHIEFPLYSYAMNMDIRALDAENGWVPTANIRGLDNAHPPILCCMPTSNAVYIPGPRSKALCVLLDARGLAPADLAVRIPAPGALAEYDYGPANYEVQDITAGSHPFAGAPPRVDAHWIPWSCFGDYRDRDIMSAAFQREIANWERDFGNTSDRSQAMRLAANFAQAFGPTKVYNRARPATQDPVRRSVTVMPTGLNIHEALLWPAYYGTDYESVDATRAYLLCSLGLTTDALGLFPFIAQIGNATLSPRINYPSACNFDMVSPAMHYSYGRRNSIIELAVLKNLVICSEELPRNLLSTSIIADVAVIKMMGQVISQTSDVIHQELNIDWFTKTVSVYEEFFVPAENVNHVGVVSNLINMSLKRAIDWVLSVGIQYPQTENEVYNTSIFQVLRDSAENIYLETLLIYPPFSRIPVWAHKNAGRIFDITNNKIDFTAGLIGRSATHFTLANDGTYPEEAVLRIFDDVSGRMPDVDGVTISGIRLTVAEIPTVLSNNTAVYLTAIERKNFATKLGYAYVSPDAAMCHSLALSPWNHDYTIAMGISFRPLPSGYIIPNILYQWADLCCLSVLCGADRDLFLGGSSNWKVFTVPESAADRITSSIPDLPDFQTFGDITSLFSY